MAYVKNGLKQPTVYAEPPADALVLSSLHPHVRALVEALVAQAEHLAKYRAGTVHLRYHRQQVKISLELVL